MPDGGPVIISRPRKTSNMSSNTAVIINTAHYIQLTCQCTHEKNHYLARKREAKDLFKYMCFVVLKLIRSYENTLNLELGDGKKELLA